MASAEEMKTLIERVRYNPNAIQRVVLDQLKNGINVVDPSNPFVFLLEAGVVTSAAALAQAEALTRKQYLSMAVTEEDLYLHMSTEDYSGRFATPARTSFTLLLGKDELYQRAVKTPLGNIRKLVIPRHSEYAIAGYKFTMQYPIELRIMPHGGLQVVYDVQEPSPLQPLESNVVPWTIVEYDRVPYVRLDVLVQQFEIIPYYSQLLTSGGFTRRYAFTDQYYYCRVYHSSTDGRWQELYTTHTDQVYDPLKPTAVLTVFEGELQVMLPQVYFSTGQLGRELRVDIYTTRGVTDLLLSNYNVENFTARWVDLNGDDDGRYSAPLGVFSSMSVFSDQAVAGGSDPLTFDALRDRVINNALGAVKQPITNVQLTNVLQDRGYRLVKNIDHITNRKFLAVRGLPDPTEGRATTPAGCLIKTTSLSYSQLERLSTVRVHTDRLTILPDTLYELVDGTVRVVGPERLPSLEEGRLDLRVNVINGERLLYSPYHYVLDSTFSTFACRPYDFNRPEVVGKHFLQENETAQLEVTTASYQWLRTEAGWRLLVQTRSGANFQALPDDQVVVRLTYRPPYEPEHAYLDGVLVGKEDGERIYQFDVTTQYDVSEQDQLYLTSFRVYDNPPQRLPVSLTQSFNLIYAVTDYTLDGLQTTSIDLAMGNWRPQLVDGVGVVQERFDLRFGHSLKGLWASARSVVGSQGYELHEEDVLAFHTQRVYKTNPVSGTIDIVTNPDGTLSYVVLHEVGDPVIDPDTGKQRVKYPKGSVVYSEETGEPVLKSEREMERQLDLFFIDGLYQFATDPTTLRYREQLVSTVTGWIIGDMKELGRGLLEQSELFLYPQQTYGDLVVVVDEGKEVSISSEQTFVVDLYVQREVYLNEPLRQTLRQTAIDTLENGLKKRTVSMTEISATLASRVGEDVLSVEIRGLGGVRDYRTLTVKDEAARCTVRKRLVVLSNDTLAVEDAVDVNFLLHLPDPI